jgi:uncharacterized protein (DUF362 family)
MVESLSPYHVRAVHCDYRASDEEIYQALKRATSPLTGAWDRLRKAGRIAIKFNTDWPRERVVMHQGHRQQLVSDPVVRATLRLLRENTKAELFSIDIGVEGNLTGAGLENCVNHLPVLEEFGVPYIYGHYEPVDWVQVPGGGLIFEKYPLPRVLVEADEVISVQKLKNHAFMGITLCLKNLFGLMPLLPHGRPRHYYHHLVRMPYMLADIGRIMDPALNIIDGLVCQAGQEWGKGDHPRICNTLVAGDQAVATDACGAHLMGHDPQSDWLTPPFHRDRNALLVAAQGGFGTVDLEAINFQSEVQAPVGEFFAMQYDTQERVINWQRTTAEQGLYYRDHRKEIEAKYTGQYVLMQMNEVRWADPDGNIRVSRRQLAGEHPDQAMWLKYVDPAEAEGEHYEVYEQTLEKISTPIR